MRAPLPPGHRCPAPWAQAPPPRGTHRPPPSAPRHRPMPRRPARASQARVDGGRARPSGIKGVLPSCSLPSLKPPHKQPNLLNRRAPLLPFSCSHVKYLCLPRLWLLHGGSNTNTMLGVGLNRSVLTVIVFESRVSAQLPRGSEEDACMRTAWHLARVTRRLLEFIALSDAELSFALAYSARSM